MLRDKNIQYIKCIMLRWLKTAKVQLHPCPPQGRVLSETDSLRDAGLAMAANENAVPQIEKGKKLKRGQYSHYDDNTRAKIAQYAVDNGVSSAARKFSKELGVNVSVTTVRIMRDAFIKLNLKKSRKGKQFSFKINRTSFSVPWLRHV